jgi:hypothetical protein
VKRQESDYATAIIRRRTWMQDAVRVYKVIVDDAVIGAIGPYQTKSFDLIPGLHRVRLAIPRTAEHRATIELHLNPCERRSIRTVRQGGVRSFLELPLALPAGAQALAAGKEIDSRYYERPWIHLAVEASSRSD